MAKVTRFPISGSKRRKNSLGKLAVPCQVSDRWLQFSKISSVLQDGDFVTLEVKTGGYSDRGRKLCELIVTREDLLAALENVKAWG